MKGKAHKRPCVREKGNVHTRKTTYTRKINVCEGGSVQEGEVRARRGGT